MHAADQGSGETRWSEQRASLSEVVPFAHVTRRLRPSGSAAQATALVTVESTALVSKCVDRLVNSATSVAVATTSGRQLCYRLIMKRADGGIPVEVTTRRGARLGDWSPPGRPGPQVVSFLDAVRTHFHNVEQGHDSMSPVLPEPLVGAGYHFGLADRRLASTTPLRPVLVHGTRTPQSLVAILTSGTIRCGADAPVGTPRFHPRADRWSGRERYVMLNLGFGRLVDDPAILAAFVFNETLATGDITLHRRPEMWETARIVLNDAVTNHSDTVAAAASSPATAPELATYLQACLRQGRVVLDVRGSRVLSAYSYEVVDALLPLRPGPMHTRLSEFRMVNRQSGGRRCLNELRRAWCGEGCYKLPYQRELPPERQDGNQILVPEFLSLDDPSFVALAVSMHRRAEAIDALSKLSPTTVHQFCDLPVVTCAGVTPLARLADL